MKIFSILFVTFVLLNCVNAVSILDNYRDDIVSTPVILSGVSPAIFTDPFFEDDHLQIHLTKPFMLIDGTLLVEQDLVLTKDDSKIRDI